MSSETILIADLINYFSFELFTTITIVTYALTLLIMTTLLTLRALELNKNCAVIQIVYNFLKTTFEDRPVVSSEQRQKLVSVENSENLGSTIIKKKSQKSPLGTIKVAKNSSGIKRYLTPTSAVIPQSVPTSNISNKVDQLKPKFISCEPKKQNMVPAIGNFDSQISPLSRIFSQLSEASLKIHDFCSDTISGIKEGCDSKILANPIKLAANEVERGWQFSVDSVAGKINDTIRAGKDVSNEMKNVGKGVSDSIVDVSNGILYVGKGMQDGILKTGRGVTNGILRVGRDTSDKISDMADSLLIYAPYPRKSRIFYSN